MTYTTDLRDTLSAMILEHDAGGITLATMREARERVEAVPAPEPKLISEEALENAIQAMAETARSWEQRCHSIMAALGVDFGGFEENVPDVGSYYQIHLARLTKERDALQDKVWGVWREPAPVMMLDTTVESTFDWAAVLLNWCDKREADVKGCIDLHADEEGAAVIWMNNFRHAIAAASRLANIGALAAVKRAEDEAIKGLQTDPESIGTISADKVPSNVITTPALASEVDWVKLAKAAGDRGIRYATNQRLLNFIAEANIIIGTVLPLDKVEVLCQTEIDRGDRNAQHQYAAGARACRDAIRTHARGGKT